MQDSSNSGSRREVESHSRILSEEFGHVLRLVGPENLRHEIHRVLPGVPAGGLAMHVAGLHLRVARQRIRAANSTVLKAFKERHRMIRTIYADGKRLEPSFIIVILIPDAP
jgi:hypothetical protein